MAAWSVAIESRARQGQPYPLREQLPWTKELRGVTVSGVGASSHATVISRNQPKANIEATSCSTPAGEPVRGRAHELGDGDARKIGPKPYEIGVTPETVSRLCEQGRVTEAVEALGILAQIRRSCVSRSLFHGVVRKCVMKRDIVLGRRVHALMVSTGCESDTFLCNHILRMYASHRRLQDAMDVFAMVAIPDAFMWSSIISAHVKYGEEKQAIQLYRRMRGSKVKPDGHVFVAALQACARGLDLEAGQQVHADVVASGVEPDLFVCSSLVDMYAKCGSLEDAQQVFDGLCRKDVVTWNAMIAGYSQRGMGQEALRLYNTMRAEMATPDSVTFVSLLQACACVGALALETGKEIHAHIIERGLQAHVLVANSLVNMYVKCGSVNDAQGVFDGMSQKDMLTWNAIICGYSRQGMVQEALHVYSAMQGEGITVPHPMTFVHLLNACASVGTAGLEIGKQLHTQIREQGHQADVVVANSLVDMYAKCGSLEDAHSVFDGLHKKDVVTWTALIGGYSQQGMGQEALQLYRDMEGEGIVAPDLVTFVCLLQACASVGIGALEVGKQLHAQISKRGDQSGAVLANSLVNMYAKCGSMEDAQQVFDGLGHKDVVTWTSLIAGYSQQGMGQEAIHLYRRMQAGGMAVPNSVTFVCLLQACASLGAPALEIGKQIHGNIRDLGNEADAFVASSLVSMYAKCGSMEDARRLFDGLDRKNVVVWNAMIAGCSQQGMNLEALRLYNAMQEEGITKPNSVTIACLLQACAGVGTPALEMGKLFHSQIREQGHQTDVRLANSLVNMYAKCGSLEDAQRVFDGLGQKDVVTWTALIGGYSQEGRGEEALSLYRVMNEESISVPNPVTFVCLLQACSNVGTQALEIGKQLHVQIRDGGHQADLFVANSLINMYAKCGSLEGAQRVFDGLGEKDVVTWTALIAGYSEQGMSQEALRLYSVMLEGGTAVPNSLTFLFLLQACSNLAALHLGRQVHAQIEEQRLETDLFIAASLINMYGKCGCMLDAQQVFDSLPERDVFVWSALIAGYSSQGDSKAVFDLVERMRADGIQPVAITCLSILTVCCHAGLVKKGREYFAAMSKQYSITPTVEHYTCMADILCRAGLLDEALGLVRAMPVVSNAAVWHTLLGACQKLGNVDVARYAFDEAVKMDKKDTAAYALMFNIYNGAQMWEQAQEIQVARIKMRAWKQPGLSWWTDTNGLVHSFLVGHESNLSRQ